MNNDEKEILNILNTISPDMIIPKDLFSIKSYSELCAYAGIKELTEEDFSQFDNPKQMLAFHQIKNIEKVYNEGWKPDFNDAEQKKYYPYFELKGGRWSFYGSYYSFVNFCGFVGLYKDKKTSDFVGKTFINIYIKVL